MTQLKLYFNYTLCGSVYFSLITIFREIILHLNCFKYCALTIVFFCLLEKQQNASNPKLHAKQALSCGCSVASDTTSVTTTSNLNM